MTKTEMENRVCEIEWERLCLEFKEPWTKADFDHDIELATEYRELLAKLKTA